MSDFPRDPDADDKWVVKNQSDHEDAQDVRVSLDSWEQTLTVSLADGDSGIEYSFAEAHALVAALKAALKEWTRRGVW